MNMLISSAILSLAIILLADSIRQLRPRKRRKNGRKTKQPMTRAKRTVIDLRETDLRKGSDAR